MDNASRPSLEEDWKVLKKDIKERLDGYSARFFALAAPSVLFPLATGVSEAMGYSLVDSPAREGVYVAGIGLHTLRSRSNSPDFTRGQYSSLHMVTSTRVMEGFAFSLLSYGIGYVAGTLADKVADFF